jgi:predicted nucleic acid-binding protein
MALLVDGALLAYVDADEDFHAASLELLQTHPGPLVVPVLVVTEVVHLIATRLGAEAELRFLADLAGGPLIIDHVVSADWQRIAELAWRYRDLRLGTATHRSWRPRSGLALPPSPRSIAVTSGSSFQRTRRASPSCPDPLPGCWGPRNGA